MEYGFVSDGSSMDTKKGVAGWDLHSFLTLCEV